ncbi:hypothetical protein GCM10008965_16680 [Methylorubrum aminovorans]
MVLSAMLPPTAIDTALSEVAASARLADRARTVTSERSCAVIVALAAWIPGVAPVPSPLIDASVARPMLFMANVPPMLTATALPADPVAPAAIAAMFAVIVLSVVAVTDSAPVALTVVFVREAETPARPPRTGAWFRV